MSARREKGERKIIKKFSASASVRGCLEKQTGPYIVLEHQQCTGMVAASSSEKQGKG